MAGGRENVKEAKSEVRGQIEEVNPKCRSLASLGMTIMCKERLVER
jgi:hypothetical protein